MSEIRLDVRLLRPGALVAGVAAGRCVLVRAVPEPGGGAPWLAALAAGLPVPEVCEARCGERHVLVAPAAGGQPLSPAVGDVARSQSVALGQALTGCGIAASQLRRGDVAVRDGVLVVRAPVVGSAAGDEAAAFAAMVAAACAPEPVPVVRRRQRAVPAAILAVAGLAVVVTLLPWPGAGGPEAPRAAAAVAAVPRVVMPEVVPGATPRPPVARVRKPVAKPKVKKAKAKAKQRRAVSPAAAAAPLRMRPAPPRPRAVTRPADDIPVAGGDADPLPAL